MATKAEDSAHPPEMVGNAFVEQYYNMLCQAPENVYKFYQNSSVISRAGSNGSMSSVSTLEGIDKMILSLDYKNCLVEILTADSQASIGNGVIVLVTGYFTGLECRKRKFSQLFLLAPQEANEYFVLNDIFRYVDSDELDIQERDNPSIITTASAPTDATMLDEVGVDVEGVDSANPLDNEDAIASEHTDAADNVDSTSQDEAQSVSDDPNPTDAQQVVESAISDNQEDAPKKSYASVANALNFKAQPFHQRNSIPKPVEKPEIMAPPPVVSPLPPSNTVVEKAPSQTVKGHSIFVANLPMNATSEQLREIFEQFGPIKPDGIRVRSYKLERNCFGFVEFESAESMQNALKATSIMIGNRNAHIEEKKATSDGSKYPSRKGGFRNDNFKNRGNYSGRGYGRNEVENQERLPVQSRSNGHQNGGGRDSRQPHETQALPGKT